MSLSFASSPETCGVPCKSIERMLDRLEGPQMCMHGYLIARYGKILSEGYWSPFRSWTQHRLYSVSKSITSLAVGLLIDEGRLSLDDPVAPYFPDKLPATLHPYLAQTTVRHLLMMATPHSETSYTASDSDWVLTFFHKKPSHPPGLIFHYDTAGTVVLSALVERIAGQPLLEYLRPRLLRPIGFSPDARCIQTPEGVSWGGSGILCTLRDMASVAQLCLDGGQWDGQRLVSEEYLRQATSWQIDNSFSKEEQCGYGYQIWRTAENGFLFYGMGCQYAFCFPDRQLLFACVGDNQIIDPRASGQIREAVFSDLLPSLSDQPLAEDHQSALALKRRNECLQMRPVLGEISSPLVSSINEKWYQLEENPLGWKCFRLCFDAEGGTLWFENARGRKRIDFGLGVLREGSFPETDYSGARIGCALGRGYHTWSSAAFTEPHKLLLTVHILDDYLGTLRLALAFADKEAALEANKAAEWFLNDYQGFAGGKQCDPEG